MALARDHEPWPGSESRDARFEPSPCRRASGFACPVVKSLLQPCGLSPPAKTRMRPKAAHEHACFAGCTNMGLTGMVFVRGYSCRAKPDSCRGTCREPKVGMARRRLTKVDGAGMSNRSRIACNSTFKSKRRRAVPAAKPLGKPPRFVVARNANPYSPLWGTDFFGKISASLPQDTLPEAAVDCGPSARQSAPCAQLR